METIVHESLGDVFLRDSCFLLQGGHVDDKLVAAPIAIGQIHDVVVFFDPVHDVVSV